MKKCLKGFDESSLPTLFSSFLFPVPPLFIFLSFSLFLSIIMFLFFAFLLLNLLEPLSNSTLPFQLLVCVCLSLTLFSSCFSQSLCLAVLFFSLSLSLSLLSLLPLRSLSCSIRQCIPPTAYKTDITMIYHNRPIPIQY